MIVQSPLFGQATVLLDGPLARSDDGRHSSARGEDQGGVGPTEEAGRGSRDEGRHGLNTPPLQRLTPLSAPDRGANRRLDRWIINL
jgi:hypothetical protein